MTKVAGRIVNQGHDCGNERLVFENQGILQRRQVLRKSPYDLDALRIHVRYSLRSELTGFERAARKA